MDLYDFYQKNPQGFLDYVMQNPQPLKNNAIQVAKGELTTSWYQTLLGKFNLSDTDLIEDKTEVEAKLGDPYDTECNVTFSFPMDGKDDLKVTVDLLYEVNEVADVYIDLPEGLIPEEWPEE